MTKSELLKWLNDESLSTSDPEIELWSSPSTRLKILSVYPDATNKKLYIDLEIEEWNEPTSNR